MGRRGAAVAAVAAVLLVAACGSDRPDQTAAPPQPQPESKPQPPPPPKPQPQPPPPERIVRQDSQPVAVRERQPPPQPQPEPPPEPEPEPMPEPPPDPEPLPQPEPPPPAEPPPQPDPEPPPPATSFGDGTWLVGTDIEPGTYRSPADPEANCYMARLSGLSGSAADIIMEHEGAGHDHDHVILIEPTDAAFQAAGCGTWRRDE